MGSTGPGAMRCAVCGERIGPGRTGGYSHRARVVAACDLDSDHRAVPDWAALGEIACRRCGGRATAAPAGGLVHVDAAHEADHAVEPGVPGG